MRRRISLTVVLAAVLAGCSGSPPAAVGDCVSDDTANVVLGQFPDVVDCPADRSFEEQLADPIYRIVAMGSTTAEVEAVPACENDFSFAIWYDEDWAICGELLS